MWSASVELSLACMILYGESYLESRNLHLRRTIFHAQSNAAFRYSVQTIYWFGEVKLFYIKPKTNRFLIQIELNSRHFLIKNAAKIFGACLNFISNNSLFFHLFIQFFFQIAFRLIRFVRPSTSALTM